MKDFEQAAERISKDVIVTPLLPYSLPDRQLALKAECLQELGSFKIRAGANAIETASDEDLLKGVVTASAGNFGQGVENKRLAKSV